jgi:ComF family protein
MQDFPFVSNTALLLYDAFTKSIIYKFKYGDKPGCARSLAALAYRHLAGVFDGADVMVPVPLYPGKRRRRGYNQAELLARELSKLCGAPVEPRALVRVRSTMPQARLNRAERENNVRGAFKANEKLKLKLILKGKKILLIDDIYTTGSTLCACAEAMREFDNVETRCFTLALAPADGGKYFES